MNAINLRGVSIALACRTFQISESCYRYERKLVDENAEIADWLVRLTTTHRTRGFGLCFLYLRNVKGFVWNHKRVRRIYRALELNIRVDNGPENVRATLQIWASKRGIGLEYIQPGKPQQNAYVERYNRTVRHEWLGQYIFETIEEAQEQATRWLWTYNNERPNMAIGGITPAMKRKTAA